MSQQQESSKTTFVAGEALEIFRRIRINAAGLAVNAVAGEEAIGITQEAKASGGVVQVKLTNGPGTFRLTASGAIVRGSLLYGTAAGKVDDAGLGMPQFLALEAASGDNAQIECARVFGDSNVIMASFTVTAPQAAAGGGNGQVDLVHNFGANPAFVMTQVRTTTGAVDTTGVVTFPDVNTVRLTGAGAGNIALNEVVTFLISRTSQV